MFENYWDFGTKHGSQDANWYNELSQEYKIEYIDKGKKVYALSYGNPFSTNVKRQNWGTDILNLTNTYGFDLIFGNYNLNKIYSYKKGNLLIKF